MSEHKDQNENTTNREKELEEQVKRALADYANLKKRFEKEKLEMSKFSNELLLMQLIGILDGLEMTTREFKKVLINSGFTSVEVNVGDKFDPNIMEAIDTSAGGEIVDDVYAPAYKLHDKIVRVAQVKLAQGKPQPEESD